MIFAELFCDGWQRERCEFSGKIHSDLPWESNISGSAFAVHIGETDVVIIGYDLLDLIDGDGGTGFLRKEGTQQRIGQLDGHKIRFVIGDRQIINQLQQSSFETTYVRFDFAGKVLQDRITEFDRVIILLLAQNGNAGFDIRRLNIDGQAAFKAGYEAFFEPANLAWRPVGGQDDLLMRIIESIEGMEEDFLQSFFSGEEMHIIDQQDIDTAKVVSEIRQGFVVEGIDIEVAEFLTEEIFDFGAFLILANCLRDRLQQVGFPEAGGAVDEKRVVNSSRGT